MSIETVEITSPGSFSVVEIRQGPAGTGGGGSNSITSATTSDGTADLDLLNVTTATAEVTGTLTANHIHGNLAGNVYAHVRAGEALTKGDPVYVSGSHGSGSTLIAIVSKADASNAAKMPAVGIMDAAVLANANGHMVIVGTITELNTDAYTVNAELYVASGGGMTSTPPSARAQPVARVERVNANNGAVIVKVNGLSASNATASTLVRRDSSGGANFAGTVNLNIGVISDLRFEDYQAAVGATFLYNGTSASDHRIALGAGTTGAALFGAATAAAANSALGTIRGAASSDVTATTQNVYVDTGASVDLTTGTWRVVAFYHGANAASSGTNVRLSASANWVDTVGRRIGTVTGSASNLGPTYASSNLSSAVNSGAAGLVASEVIAIVKMTGAGTLSMQVANNQAVGTVTSYSGSHIVATKL
jgi:hypothetical protein